MSSDESDDEPLAVLAAAKQLDPKKFTKKLGHESDDDYDPKVSKPKKKKKAKKTKTVTMRKEALSMHLLNKVIKPPVVQRPDDVWLYLKDFNPSGPYSCLLCPEWFISKSKAVIHYILNHKKDYCGICRYFVTDRDAWDAHLRFHTPWPCSQCNELFVTELELRQHLSEVHNLVHCKICHFRVPDNELYLEHLNKKHNMTNLSYKDADIFWQMNPDCQGFFCLFCSKSNILPTAFFGHYVGYHHYTIKCITSILRGKDTPFSLFGADLSQPFIESLKGQGKCGYVDLETTKPPVEPHYSIKREEVFKGLLVDVKEEVLSDNEDTKKEFVVREDFEIIKTYKGDKDFDVTQMELIILQKFYFDYLDEIVNSIKINNVAPVNSTVFYEKEKPNIDLEINCTLCKTKHITLEAYSTHVCKTHNVRTVPIFSCRVCATTFDSQYELENHITEELGEFEDLWICQFCDKEFENRAATRCHLSEHQGDLDSDNCFSPHLGFKCRYCPTLFWNEPDREEHQIKAHFEKNMENFYKCECNEVFSDKIWFTYHYFKYHQAENPATHLYKCCFCSVVLKSVDHMRNHFEDEHPEAKKLFCSLEGCQYRPLSHKKSFQLHLRSQHRAPPRKDQSFACAVCAREFSTNKACSAHTAQAHGPGKFKCRICRVMLHSVDERKLHYMLQHPGTHPFACEQCGKSFLYKSSLYMHKKEHSGDKQDYTCKTCHKVFAKKDSFREHQMIHEVPRHACSYCPMRFVQRSNMLRHERRHTGERPYQCPHCERTFADKGACNSHTRTHIKTTSFDCLYCGASFRQKSKLTYHIRRHTGQNLETCTICSKLFTSACSLREHMKNTHESKKPGDFKCPLCDRTYIDERLVLRHLRISHQSGEHPCPLCKKILSSVVSLRQHVLTHSKKHIFWCKICPKSYNIKRTMVRHLRRGHSLKGSEVNVKDFYRRLDPRECQLQLDEATINSIFGKPKRNVNDVLLGDFITFPKKLNVPENNEGSGKDSDENEEGDDDNGGEKSDGDATEGDGGEQELEPTDFVSIKIEPMDDDEDE